MMRPNDEFSMLATILLIFAMMIIVIIVFTLVFIEDATGDRHMSAHALVVKELQMEEGFRGKPYKDTTGHWTIGYGKNLEGRTFKLNELDFLFKDHVNIPHTVDQYVKYWEHSPMTKEEAEYILEIDISYAEIAVKKIYYKVWDQINDERKAALIDLMFNLGSVTYKEFKKHIEATKKLDWEQSAAEVLDSRAAKQNKRRYHLIAGRLRGSHDKATEKVSGSGND